MVVRINPDESQAHRAREALDANDGYCPCALIKDQDSHCMCKDFRDKLEGDFIGLCNCGLYEVLR